MGAFIPTGQMVLPSPQFFPRAWGARVVSSTTKVAAQAFVPKDGTVSKIRFGNRDVATGGDVRASVYSINTATGAPNAIYAAGATGVLTVNAADDDQFLEVTLGTPVALTAGEVVSLVVEWAAGTPSIEVPFFAMCADSGTPGHHYDVGAGWVSNGGPASIFMFFQGDTDYVPHQGQAPCCGFNGTTINSGSSPNEYGNKFTLPFGAKVNGIWFYDQASYGAYDVTLYDSASTVLATASVAAGAAQQSDVTVVSIDEVQLTRDATYRVAVKPTSGTNLTLTRMGNISGTFDPNMLPWPNGSTFHETRRTGAGVWTDVTYAVMDVGISVSEVELGLPISYGFA